MYVAMSKGIVFPKRQKGGQFKARSRMGNIASSDMEITWGKNSKKKISELVQKQNTNQVWMSKLDKIISLNVQLTKSTMGGHIMY